MTRDETVALFLECETKRAEARAAALLDGVSEGDAAKSAHQSAKAHWNDWAARMLAARAALERSGEWAAQKADGMLWTRNHVTHSWLETATADFSNCYFLIKQGTNKEAAEDVEGQTKGDKKRQLIEIDASMIDFEGFIFPGNTRFDCATFSGPVSFERANFCEFADFDSTLFQGYSFFQGCLFKGANFSGWVSFSKATFEGNASFSSATFSWTAVFDHLTFSKEVFFHSCIFSDYATFTSISFSKVSFYKSTFSRTASFDYAAFSGDASFEDAEFLDQALFNNATFSRRAKFWSATFSKRMTFERASFQGETIFNSATLSNVDFEAATFAGDVQFIGTIFSDKISFRRAAFRDGAAFHRANFTGPASFASAIFGNATYFNAAKFVDEADFEGIKAERTFDMAGATFSKVPAFNQSDFKQAPDLDQVDFPLDGSIAGNQALAPLYRALRRMAIQGADYEREQLAFKGELRSRRWSTDKPWHIGLWLGIFYDAIADCGRSIVRPLFAWLLVIISFSGFYLFNAGVLTNDWQSWCEHSPMRKWERALSLSMSVAVPVIGNSRAEEVKLFYDCMSEEKKGSEKEGSISSKVPLSANVLQVVEFSVERHFDLPDPARGEK